MQDKIQTQAKIKALRQEIDNLDSQLLSILKNRQETVKKIGLLKRKTGQNTIAPEREKEILSKCKTEFEKTIMQKIIEESRKIQE